VSTVDVQHVDTSAAYLRSVADPARVSTLLEGASFPAALWSGSDLRFTWTNRFFRDLLEDVRPQYDLLGMPVRGFLSDSHSAARFIDVAYTGQPSTEHAYEYRASWGETTYWQLSYLPVPARIGDPYDVLLVAVDVSALVTDQRKVAEHQADLRRALDLIDVTVLSSLDAEDILQRVLVEATEALDADWGWIAEREGNGWLFRNVHGWPAEMAGLRFAEDDLSLPGLVANSGRAIAVSQSDATRREQFELMVKHDIGAFALVPVKSRGEVVDVMGFCWDSDVTFGDAHHELLRKLELSLSLAMENARQYDDQRRLNRTLRGAFFSAPAEVSGFEMGHLYHVASGTVGGDFYDVMSLPGGRVGVLIGDVAGHGAEAAGLTALVKSAIRAEALRLPSPESVMDRANELVLHGAAPHEFVSAFFGLVDASSGHMAYSMAGHPPPVLLRAGAEPVLLQADGSVLGAGGGLRYENHGTVLDIGDMLVLYTDGLTEARSARGEVYGTERLLAAVAASAAESADRVPETLFLSAFGHAEGRLADDIAIVALRRTGSADGSEQGRLELESAVA
jgi:serine phosphatase RsbU (regulator of sigma subunit)